MSGRVFISYARPDRPYVERLADHLSDNGVPVWFDHELATGDQWLQVIRGEIDRCVAFMVVMTPDSEDSDWVNREITRAEDKDKPIFPVLLRGERFFRLSDLQFENVNGGSLPTSTFIATLVAQVEAAASTSWNTDESRPIRRNVRIVHPTPSKRTLTAQRILRLVAALRERPDENFLILEEMDNSGRWFQTLLESGIWYVEYKLGEDGPHFGTITHDRSAVEKAALGWARGEEEWKQGFPWWKNLGVDGGEPSYEA
jgi:hypothetical protein